MSRLPALLTILCCVTACVPQDDTPSSPSGFVHPSGQTHSDGGPADGGGADGGGTCPADSDGTFAGNRVVVSELFFGSQPFLELHNGTNAAVALSTLTFDGTFVPNFADTSLTAGGSILGGIPASRDGELLIKESGTGTVIFYVCWGSPTPTSIQNDAVVAGVWTTAGVCAQLSSDTAQSIHLTGGGNKFSDWSPGAPTPLGCQ